MAVHFKAPIVLGKFSRLLIDLNRNHQHKHAFSAVTKILPRSEREQIIAIYHRPHWEKIQLMIDKKIANGFSVIHLGVHSFTPILNGELRNAEIGILYDSRRKSEAKLAIAWQRFLRNQSDFRVRRNYPYNGMYDGMTSNLRKRYPESQYRGFELEVNHDALKTPSDRKLIEKLLIKTMQATLVNF